jgi:hypothetical protein
VNRKERIRQFDESRDIDGMPIFGRMSRILGPRPALQVDERRLMNASATRVGEPRSWLWSFGLRRGIRSEGRLVLTDRRLIYTTGRDPATFGLAKHPESVGNVDTPLSSVRKVRSRRQGWLGYFAGWMPGSMSLSIELDDGVVVTFANVYGRWWDAATEEIATKFPALKREDDDDQSA